MRIVRTALGTVLLPLLVTTAAGEEPPGDTVVLPGGERLVCHVLRVGPRFVEVEVGGTPYELERVGLDLGRDGAFVPDPLWQALIDQLVPRVVSPDPAVANAARLGLLALGERARPYLDAARSVTEDAALVAALEGLDTQLRGAVADLEGLLALVAAVDGLDTRQHGADLEGLMAAARDRLALEADQQDATEAALTDFARALATGQDPADARREVQRALAEVLSDAQRAILDEILREASAR